MLIVLGTILLLIAGGLLHDVPFTRFLLATICWTLGGVLMRAGMV